MKSIRFAVLITTALLAASLIAQDAPPGGAVEGTVVNTVTGAGIGGASVVLSANASARYETTSDGAGHFRITGIAPGSYRATTQKDGFASPPPDLNFFSNAGLRIASGSDPVKVELKLTPLNTVFGRVFGPDGKPTAGMEVSLYPNVTADMAVTDEEGRFALENIRPGSYNLVARPPASAKPEEGKDGTRTAIVSTYYPSVADPSLAEQIVLRGQWDGAYEIRMQTVPVHRVRGVVQDEEGRPAPGAELTLLPIPKGAPEPMGLAARRGLSFFAVGARPRVGGVPETTATAGEDGHFEFPAVPSGDWRISAVSDPGADAQKDGGTSSHGTAGAFIGRDDVDDLRIEIATPFKLTGTIEWKGEDSGSQRISNPQLAFGDVTLMNADRSDVAISIVDSRRLLFENVLPGRYEAIVRPGLAAQIFLGDNEVTGTFPVAASGPPLRVVFRRWTGTLRGTVEKGAGATVILVPQRSEGVAIGQTVVCSAGGSFELSEVTPGGYYIAAFDQIDGLVPSAAILNLVPTRGTSVKVEEHSVSNVMLSVITPPR